MASVKYGCLNPNAKTIEYPVAASQYFPHASASVVYLDGSGHLTMALTATGTVAGVAIVPTGMGAGTSSVYWKSSATAGADKLAIIPVSENEEFLFPADDTVTAAMAGNACDLIGVNDGTIQQVDVGTSSTDIFLIVGRGVDRVAKAATTDAVVKINPAKVQADT